MAKMVLLNCREFCGAADLTANTSKVEVKSDSEVKETTNYGSGGWKEVIGGIFSTSINDAGQWEAGDTSKPDDAAWAGLGIATPVSVCPDTAADGALSYLTSAVRMTYNPVEGSVGDVAGFSGALTGTWPMVRGTVAHPPGTVRTASGDGTGINLGALSATQWLYANLHVLSVAGTATPTVTMEIESDADNTFASASSVLAFDAATAPVGQSKRVIGPITDEWFRATWTITGTNPSFLFVVTLGVK